MAGDRTARPAIAAATTLGIGLGGFFDGILFHQILQVHNMLSARIPTDTLVGAKINMVWDGIFHSIAWALTLLGVWMLWRAARRGDVVFDNRALVGGGLLGWGLFNVTEGVIDHHILSVHHVYERLGQSGWDYGFLAWGAAMIVIGWILTRAASRRAEDASDVRRSSR
jgi:uncharacterized membrane protein